MSARYENTELWMHEDVLDAPRRWPHLAKRLGLVLQHLLAFGRTPVTKGDHGANRGWRRSPLGGGSSGMRFYVWWTRGGSAPLRGREPTAGRHILVRAIRAHGDHRPLAPGDWEKDYCPILAADLEDPAEPFVAVPWTDAQTRYAADASPVRLIHGLPGSGKTSVLWRAVETLPEQRVLYLTWSAYLTAQAEARFAAYAPASVSVRCLDFAACLSQLGGRDLPRAPLAARIARLATQVRSELWRIRDRLGPWPEHVPALYAELRGVLLGQALPGDPDACRPAGVLRLTDAAYRARRTAALGPAAVEALLALVAFWEAHGPAAAWAELFPDLAGADRALARLRAHGVPAELAACTHLAVDELQDLTLREILVVAELARGLGAGAPVTVTLAADAGQTVRPTAFAIGPVKSLLRARLGTVRECGLDVPLRSPRRLSEVIDRATALYGGLAKQWRPTDQTQAAAPAPGEAERLHATAPDWAAGGALLQRLQDEHQVNAVCLRAQDRARTPDTVDLLDPETVKGLEFATVCVLNPGALLLACAPAADAAEPLAALHRRTQIDRLRVALSRAASTLIFLDVAPAPDALRRSHDLLGEAAVYAPAELLAHLAAGDRDPATRAAGRAQEARALADADPGGAWRRAVQAWSLLGGPHGVTDAEVRTDVTQTVLAVGALLLATVRTDAAMRREVERQGRRLLPSAAAPLWKELAQWGPHPAHPPFALLDAWAAAPVPWLPPALGPRREELRQRLRADAGDPGLAPRYAGPVEDWLRCLGTDPAGARALRRQAADTLLAAARWDAAATVLRRLGPGEEARWGRLEEGRGRQQRARQDRTPPAQSAAARDRQTLLQVRATLCGDRNTALDDTWREDNALPDFAGITLGGDPPRVAALRLEKAGLQGTIPAALSQLTQLTHLDLSSNALTGPIPPELSQLTQLTHLDLSSNALTGPISPELSQLTQLTYLKLFSNALTGPIPPELSQLTQLTYLDLSANALTGPIPPELGQLSQLAHLLLADNRLRGPIPPELGQLSQLWHLLLSDNRLRGPIPPELGQLSQLRHLGLSNNRLTGTVPPALGKLPHLTVFVVLGNRLTGMPTPELLELAQPWLPTLPLSADGPPPRRRGASAADGDGRPGPT